MKMVSELSYTLRLNTGLFLNATAGISEADAVRRVSARVNSISFVAAHLIDVRHYFAREIGVVGWNPVASALEFARGIDDVGQVPPLEKLREAWLDISAAVTIGMSSIDAKQFSRPLLRSLPFGATTLQAGLTFLLQHEMYHIGQIAMLRKELGYDAMSWSEPQY